MQIINAATADGAGEWVEVPPGLWELVPDIASDSASTVTLERRVGSGNPAPLTESGTAIELSATSGPRSLLFGGGSIRGTVANYDSGSVTVHCLAIPGR